MKKNVVRVIGAGLLCCVMLAGCAGGGNGGGTAASQSGGESTEEAADKSASQSGGEGTEAAADEAVTEEASAQSTSESPAEDTAAADASGASTGDTTVPAADAPDEAEDDTSDETPVPTLLYQGHGSLRVETGDGKVFYIDPFAGEGYDLPADLIMVTHGHYDHNGLDRIMDHAPACLILTQDEALLDGMYQSYTLGTTMIEPVEAGYNANHDVKNCVGYILTFGNGVQLYVSGDTSKTPMMEELASRKIDYAFFCCDGVYNMGTAEASECAALVGAKHSIPYHTTAADKGLFDRKTAEAFTADGRLILEPGDTLVLE